MKFHVTYQIVTEESAEQGEAAESGFIDKDLGLRVAVDAVFRTRTLFVGGYSTIYDDRTLTVDNGMEFLTGAYESRSLHRDRGVTDTSWARLCRLLGDWK